jgi:Mtf2 family
MSQQKQLQRAAIRLYNLHSCTPLSCFIQHVAPILTFLLPRRDFSTSYPCTVIKKNQVAKEVDVPGHIFRIPGVNRSRHADVPEFLDDVPPSSNTPPFLKIVMPDTPSFSSGHFRPESSAIRTLTGSTISSSEREVFARIFDEMLTQPISESGKRHRFLRSNRIGKAHESTSKSKGLSLSAALLDESLLLTPEEVEEYPVALRPLAAAFAREESHEEKDPTWEKWEKRIDSCRTDFDLARLIDSDVFSVMEARAQGVVPLPGKEPFTTLRPVYSLILIKTMRRLRVVFHNALAAHTLFLRAKMLSAESYVLGCTVQLYNELLLSRWESFTDLFSISEILDEMSTNGVKGDEETVDILQRIQDDVHEWATHGAEAARPVWLAEKERMGKLERIRKEILASIENEVDGKDTLEMEKEVQKLGESKTQEMEKDGQLL